MNNPHPDTKTTIVANFVYVGKHDENLASAILPALPRVGDKIKKSRPDSPLYVVKCVTFEVSDIENQRAAILVLLEAEK